MDIKRSPDKPIPRISDGTYVGEVSRLDPKGLDEPCQDKQISI